uniref:Uncharacterized protein n=1 Tax=Arundo donax TaxID=35708 RepID=A0A0A8ZZQ2_ARUDO
MTVTDASKTMVQNTHMINSSIKLQRR